MIKEPMLAGKGEGGKLETLLPHLVYPCLLSMKLDGIRAIVDKNSAGKVDLYSRRLKLIPNELTRTHFGKPEMYGADGELIVGSPFAEDVFHRTDSGVMSSVNKRHDPKAVFYMFDDFTRPELPFEKRIAIVESRVKEFKAAGMRVGLVPHIEAKRADDVIAFNAKCLKAGYEGIMVRSLVGQYKFGRSSLSQGWLLKAKPREDFEATCIGWVEGMTNTNVAETNELGRTKRSSHKAGKIGRGTLGALMCRTVEGIEFQVGNGPGLTEEIRAALYRVRDTLPGRIIKCSSLPIGVKDKPRHPQMPGAQFKALMQGFRSEFEE